MLSLKSQGNHKLINSYIYTGLLDCEPKSKKILTNYRWDLLKLAPTDEPSQASRSHLEAPLCIYNCKQRAQITIHIIPRNQEKKWPLIKQSGHGKQDHPHGVVAGATPLHRSSPSFPQVVHSLLQHQHRMGVRIAWRMMSRKRKTHTGIIEPRTRNTQGTTRKKKSGTWFLRSGESESVLDHLEGEPFRGGGGISATGAEETDGSGGGEEWRDKLGEVEESFGCCSPRS